MPVEPPKIEVYNDAADAFCAYQTRAVFATWESTNPTQKDTQFLIQRNEAPSTPDESAKAPILRTFGIYSSGFFINDASNEEAIRLVASSMNAISPTIANKLRIAATPLTEYQLSLETQGAFSIPIETVSVKTAATINLAGPYISIMTKSSPIISFDPSGPEPVQVMATDTHKIAHFMYRNISNDLFLFIASPTFWGKIGIGEEFNENMACIKLAIQSAPTVSLEKTLKAIYAGIFGAQAHDKSIKIGLILISPSKRRAEEASRKKWWCPC